MAPAAALREPVDAALRSAVDAGVIPGVVAMAATERGLLYEGAFGRRMLGGAEAMTLDSVFRIASMTKAITSVAAMQLVEQGKLALEAPVPDIDPTIGAPQVLEGFNAAGAPRLRPARRPITLRHLLTHTAGFAYDMWNPTLGRYLETAGLPLRSSGRVASIRMPLVFDPGERWEYGINTDWVGRLVEAASGLPLDVYFRERIFAPLGMVDSGYVTTDAQRARQARLHQRRADGSLLPQPLEPPAIAAEFWSGGGPLYSTGRDYLQFLQMLLHGGEWKGARLLRAETVALMHGNHIGDLPAGVMRTARPEMSADVDLFPGARVRWGLGYMLNLDAGANGRSAGTVSWGGLYNTYYWLDPVRRVTGVILTQVLPFADPGVLGVYGAFERAVYEVLRGA